MLAAIACLSLAQTTLTGESLLADMKVLRAAFTRLHPGLYRYNTPGRMEANFRQLEQCLSDGATVKEAYLRFAEFTAKVKCGHTYPNFFNQPESIVREVFDGQNRLPFLFHWHKGQMLVTKILASGSSLKVGDVVMSLDGVASSKILSTLLQAARADGSNDAKRISDMELLGQARYEAFDIFYPLYFPKTKGAATVDVQSPRGNTRRLQIALLSREDRDRAYEALQAGRRKRGSPWTFTAQGQIGVLTMPTWALYNDNYDWKSYITRTFETLNNKRIRRLVIDLRGNEGGDSVGDEIITHLTRKALRFPTFQGYVRYNNVDDGLRPYLDTWDRSFDDWSKWTDKEPITKFEIPYFRMRRWDTGSSAFTIQPKAPYYSGKIAVLVDASNSSATFEFAQQVQQRKLATLIGQPTGGNQRGINGSAFYFLRLPNSKIEVDLPLVAQFPVEEAPDSGLEPDIKTSASAKDIADGRDISLSTARRFLLTEKAWLADKDSNLD